MRTIYLIRHGHVAFPDGERRCISRTDLPLSPAGREQALALRRYFARIPLSGVYHSRLRRARETALLISPEAKEAAGLEELGVGLWEGMTFREIRSAFPELFRKRGEDPEQYPIPGGELLADCLERASQALGALRRNTSDDFAVVAHAGINRLLLCGVRELPLRDFLTVPQPYGCINSICEEGDRFTVGCVGLLPPGIGKGGSL